MFEVLECNELVGLKFLLVAVCIRLVQDQKAFVSFYKQAQELVNYSPNISISNYNRLEEGQINFLKKKEDICIRKGSEKFKNALEKINEEIRKLDDKNIKKFA